MIPDERALNLPAHLAPGEYALHVGLYLAPNGPRLPLKPSAGDSFTLGTLRVMQAASVKSQIAHPAFNLDDFRCAAWLMGVGGGCLRLCASITWVRPTSRSTNGQRVQFGQAVGGDDAVISSARSTNCRRATIAVAGVEFFAGSSEFALRYFSLIFGVLGVALIYRLGRRGLGTALA